MGVTVTGGGKVTGGKERNGDKHRGNSGVCYSHGGALRTEMEYGGIWKNQGDQILNYCSLIQADHFRIFAAQSSFMRC